jgi:hypothetical protein
MCRHGARNPIRSTQAPPVGDVAHLTRQPASRANEANSMRRESVCFRCTYTWAIGGSKRTNGTRPPGSRGSKFWPSWPYPSRACPKLLRTCRFCPHAYRVAVRRSRYIRPSAGKSSFASPLDQVRGALVCRGAHRWCRGLRSLAVWSRILPWSRFSHRVCSLASCAEVVTINLLWVRRDSSVVQFNPESSLGVLSRK